MVVDRKQITKGLSLEAIKSYTGEVDGWKLYNITKTKTNPNYRTLPIVEYVWALLWGDNTRGIRSRYEL